jgi:peptidyl-prolyl cis-trans isomerase SurA
MTRFTVRPFGSYSFIFALLILLNGCSTTQQVSTNTNSSDKSPVVATYGNESIRFQELQRQARKTGSSDSTATGYQEFLKRYLNFRLKVAEAERLGMDKDTSVVNEINTYKGQLGRPYLVENEVIRPLTKQLYDRQKETVKVRHILVRVTAGSDTTKAYAKIKAVRDSLLAGQDFVKIAKRNSEDETVADNNGDLPLITAGRYVQEFEDLAFTTPVGKYSVISRSQEYGYHLLQVLERKTAVPAMRSSQIYVRPESAQPADTLAAYNLAQSLHQRLKAGEDFATLARQYADDDVLKENGGDMGFRDFGDLVEPFNTKVFSLKNVGDMTEPFRSNYGYHILKLTGKKDGLSYDQSYNDLKELVQNLPALKRREQALAHRLRTKLNVTFDENLFNGAIQTTPQDSLFLNFGPAGTFRPKHGKKTFASIEGKPVTMEEFADVAMRFRPSPSQYPAREARRIAEELVDEKAIEAYVLKLDMMDPKFDRLLKEYREGVLLFKISEDSLWNKTSRDSLGLKRYFAANKGKYRFPERTKIYSFYSPVDTILTRVDAKLKTGMKPEAVAALFKDPARFRMDTVFLSDSTKSVYDQGFSLKPQTWTAPLQYQRGKVLLYSDGKVPAREKTFDEARAEITSEYQKSVEEQWMQRLYRRYTAKMYPERIPQAMNAPKK